ncbi:hypothetical protein [Dubosiella newyorkensis]|uniref:hypothetical protein n=1 Tax=Dubosiella newyorkensis TaxID=1862672 RepID=UPI002583942D|nr:hypothetical protein [Dubosiella newyorkensis]
MSKRRWRYNEFNISTKDFPEVIQFILRKILDRSDLVVKSIHIQDVMVSMTSKTSRLDVFAEDGYLGNIDQKT